VIITLRSILSPLANAILDFPPYIKNFHSVFLD
jgi:hypothetical protein